MFSCEVPWTFFCKMVEIPQKLQESNSRITKNTAPFNGKRPPYIPLDKIQTFNSSAKNRLGVNIASLFSKYLERGGGGCVAPWILPFRTKVKFQKYTN